MLLKRLTAHLGILTVLLSLCAAYFVPQLAIAQSDASASDVVVYLLGRDDCGFCQKEFAWLEEEGINYEYLNIVKDEAASQFFVALAEKHDISKVTPMTVVGERIIVGFNGPETTGKAIKEAIAAAATSDIRTLEEHLERAPAQSAQTDAGCSEVECDTGGSSQYVFDLPVLGIVDLKSFSLFSLSLVLGVIDGFNPCAMWVLITFLVLLSQAGSRRKMIFLAGLFIAAEAIMYNLILNVWYKTWNFVALDQVVVPMVGLLALGGGSFFLYRWYRNRDAALVCDISSLDQQTKIVDKFTYLVNQPLTLLTVGSIIVIAFSVNVIEFACSIGIPQAYTKILEINFLTFMERQWYILVYTFGYMVDDFIVFGLAIWGYGKLQAHGQKYSQLSLLIGGALMLVLGLILVLNPELLVF